MRNHFLTSAALLTVLTGALATRCYGAQNAAPDWRAMIISQDERDRDAAASLLLNERAQTIKVLLEIVRSPVRVGEPFLLPSSRNTAISILGAMRAREAVPDLCKWLEIKKGQVGTYLDIALVSIPPAGRALIEIGYPAVPHLLQIIRDKGCSSPRAREAIIDGNIVRFKPDPTYRSSPLGDKCLSILVKILTAPGARDALGRASEKETDKTSRENLESAIKVLEAREKAKAKRPEK